MGKKANKEIKHLLIVRFSAMGDVAMVTHAISALRAEYPKMRVSVLTRPAFRAIFKTLDVDFIDVDLKGQHKGVLGMKRLAGELKENGVDAIADMHGVIRSRMLCIFAALHGIKTSKIHKSRFRKWMRMDGGCSSPTQPIKHTVLRYCDTLRRLGLNIKYPEPAKRMRLENPLSMEKGEELWVGVAPFSAHEGKIYPLNQMRQVIEGLAERYDKVFVHSGPGKELFYAEEMERDFENVYAVFSRLKLSEELDLISNLDCMVSMDSFAMHVASMFATPIVSVWGATHPHLGFSAYGCSPEGIVQMADLTCRPCSTYGDKPCRFGDYNCLSQISPNEIVDRVALVMGGTR